MGRRLARRGSGRNRVALLGLLGLAALGGCTEGGPDVQVGRGDIRNAIARGSLTSPDAPTVALVSLDGAPQGVADRFRHALTEQAASREIAMTDLASARFLLRDYLSAYPEEGGIRVAYTYDVFDAATHRRRLRLADAVVVPPAAGTDDPWGAVTDTVLAGLISRGTDDLAAALAGTAEAQVAAVPPPPAPAPTN